jgi:hypothetical protein
MQERTHENAIEGNEKQVPLNMNKPGSKQLLFLQL